MSNMVESMNRISDTSKKIEDIISQIESIASQTNLLSLNASIEAARAGQMGAGFAVVASKVQVLAEDSNKCSAQIATVVNSMESLIQTTAKQLGNSQTAVDNSITSLNDETEKLRTSVPKHSSIACSKPG